MQFLAYDLLAYKINDRDTSICKRMDKGIINMWSALSNESYKIILQSNTWNDTLINYLLDISITKAHSFFLVMLIFVKVIYFLINT